MVAAGTVHPRPLDEGLVHDLIIGRFPLGQAIGLSTEHVCCYTEFLFFKSGALILGLVKIYDFVEVLGGLLLQLLLELAQSGRRIHYLLARVQGF